MAGKWDRPSAEAVRARRLEAQREYAAAHGRGNGAAGLGRRQRPRGDVAGNCVEIEYSDEEREFLVAVDRYKAETGTLFPTLTQLLAVLKGLGYRRVID